MATYAPVSPTDTESGDQISNNKSDKCQLSLTKLILVIFTTVIITALITNMDRIVASNQNNINESTESSDSSTNSYTTPSPTPQTYANEYDIVIIGAGVTGLLHSHFLSTESSKTYSTLTIERYNRLCGRTHSVDIQHNDKA